MEARSSDIDSEDDGDGQNVSKEVWNFEDIMRSIHSFTTTTHEFAQCWSSIWDIHSPHPRICEDPNEFMKALIASSTTSLTSIVVSTPLIVPAEKTEPPTQFECDQKLLSECEPTKIATPDRIDKHLDDIAEPTPPKGQFHREPKPPTIFPPLPILLSSSPAELAMGTTYSAITKTFNDALILSPIFAHKPHLHPSQSSELSMRSDHP